MISIIISAHNEEKNIINILLDLKEELKIVKEKKEIFICLSGCTDKTGEIARSFIKKNKLGWKIIITPKGKIKSQKEVLKRINKNSWGILFLDCDIRLGKKSVFNIISEGKKYGAIKLFYAFEIPIKRKSLFYNLINVRTINPEYVIARENVSAFHPYEKNKRKKVFATGGMYLIRKGIYDVDENTIGDDSYLTHSIYHRFGFGTIKQTESAIIFYQPVYTFKSWIRKWKRIWGDIGNLYINHPEFRYLEKYMKLKVDFKRILKEGKMRLFCYFIIERIWNYLGGFIFKNILFKKRQTDWKPLNETKEIIIK